MILILYFVKPPLRPPPPAPKAAKVEVVTTP